MTLSTETPNRRLLIGGLAAAASLAAAGAASAQTPARPQGTGRFAGRVVAITGGTSGIGRVAAELFAREGAIVTFNGRREALGREVEAGIRRAGGQATYIRTDVRERAQAFGFVEQTVARHGRLDVLFNNAGIGQPFVELTQVGDDNLNDMWRTNVQGKIHTLQAAIPYLRTSRGNAINTTSIFGIKAGATAAAYSATMHAITGLTMGAALENAPHGVRINAVAPGAITDTDFVVPLMGRRLNAEEIAQFGPLHALGRTGRAEEVARTVMFLASDDASFVTGEIMKVDGYFLRG